MKIPFDWLAEFVDLKNITPEKLAEELSLKAFEVEDIDWVGPKITGPLVAGKIQQIDKHPNADKLQVTKTQVAAGEELRQIVCGARNIEVGQTVPVALPGSCVINRQTGEPLPIKVGKIRDVESGGMLCSGSELGLEGGEGICILPGDIAVGTDLIEKLNLKPKAILNVASRSNRGDALSILGIARETAATLKTPLINDVYNQDYNSKFNQVTQSAQTIKASIQAKDACHVLGFFKINKVKIAESPDWLKEKLKLSGVSSINNIVDITNYVMLQIGQPMHAYDASKLDLSGGVTVRFANEGERLLTLDDEDKELTTENLLIADAQNPLSLAGVMGGLPSAITESTTCILLEAACFEPSFVRRSSRLSGISTESSRRFERGTDSELVKIALLQACELIQSLAGGELEGVAYINNAQSAQNNTVQFSRKRFYELIGQEVSEIEATEIFTSLGLKVLKQNDGIFEVGIPSFRARDLERPIDLIEEVARFLGLNKIQSQPLPGVSKFLHNPASTKTIKETLIAQGYAESIFSSLVPAKDSESDAIKMKNPLSQDHAQLRKSLLPGLLMAVAGNFRRQIESVKLFEIGRIYSVTPALNEANERSTGCKEEPVLGIILSEKSLASNWQGTTQNTGDFFELKALIENLCERRGKLQFNKFVSNDGIFHPGVSAEIILNGRKIGELGQIHPLKAEEYDLPQKTFVAQLQMEPLTKPIKFKLKALNENSLLNRDFTIDLPTNSSLTNTLIERAIEANKFKNLQDFKLLSLYQPKDKALQSLSYRLVFQAEPEKNLSGDEINSQIANFKNELTKKFPEASFRE